MQVWNLKIDLSTDLQPDTESAESIESQAKKKICSEISETVTMGLARQKLIFVDKLIPMAGR